MDRDVSKPGLFDAFIGLEKLPEYAAEQTRKRGRRRTMSPGRARDGKHLKREVQRDHKRQMSGSDWIKWANKT